MSRYAVARLRATGGLAQAGAWLTRQFVQFRKFVARPSVSGTFGAKIKVRQAAGRYPLNLFHLIFRLEYRRNLC